ncbi:GGDEF domain-containing protein [Eubacteriaceae bacterium ES3]|nr:GGDEF domain-containing protein [Eubacteriaceae bacterium ES3]
MKNPGIDVRRNDLGKVISLKINKLADLAEELFHDILQKKEIETVFQPIVSIKSGRIFGYEALSRGPVHTPLHFPDELFNYAEKLGKVWELEYLCRTKALESAMVQKINGRLFLNVNPNIMKDDEFKKGFTREYLNRFSIDPKQIVFEITEREAIDNMADFINIISHYKEQDYRIAIDDAGAGYSGLNLISDIHPNFIKLDMKLVRNVDKDMTKQSLIRSLNEFARFTGTSLIAEGIETEEELEALIEIGVEYGQGYLIQRPHPKIKEIDAYIVERIKIENDKKIGTRHELRQQIKVDDICRMVKFISPDMLVSDVYAMFEEDPRISGYCIVKKSMPIGVITRNDLYRKISGQFGYTLYANKPVSKIMDTDFTLVDYQSTIDATGKIAMDRDPEKIYDFVIVTNRGRYYGVVTVKDLMEKLIEMEFVYAKHLNPLTELPGNIMIEEKLTTLIKNGEDMSVLYFDLDNFKVYNDVYGFEKGDVVLKEFSFLLRRELAGSFIGHIGGDDFVAVVPWNQAELRCQAIIEAFDLSVRSFYREEDIEKGFILARNRHDEEEAFPLLSVSIAGVRTMRYKNIYELSEVAAKVKKICKKRSGSQYCLKVRCDDEGLR